MSFDLLKIIKNLINKIPIFPLFFGYLLYLAYCYYSFENDVDSPKNFKLRDIALTKEQAVRYEKKYQELTLFVKKLEDKKVELRTLSQELQDAKGALSEDIDIPGFMKMVTTEAKKINLGVLMLRPEGSKDHLFYGEVHFKLGFRGVFFQVVNFLQRLSNLSRIIHVDDFKIVVNTINPDSLTVLDGELGLTVFKYIGSHEDKLGSSVTSVTPGPDSKEGDNKPSIPLTPLLLPGRSS